MNRWNSALALVMGTALAACQAKAPEKSTLEAENEALKKRVEALEQQSQAAPTTQPAEPVSVVAAPGVHSRTVEARTVTRPARRAPARRAPAAEPAEEPREARVERIRPAAEPMVGTGDPGPRRERTELPGGTTLNIVLETPLSSATANVGDPVVARVERATSEDGRVVLPGGTVLKGRVYRAESAGRVKGRSRLAVDFDRIVVRGREHRLDTTAIDVEGPESHKRDAAIIGGSTAAGAIVGGIADGGKGARKGAIIGAVGGAGAVLATKGREIEMPSGSRWTVRVKDAVTLD